MLRLLPGLSCALPLAGLAALVPAVQAAPVGGGSGSYGVASRDVEVTVVSPPLGDAVYVSRYSPGAELVLQFPVTTTSRWPVRLEEVVTDEPAPPCGWRPERVELVDDRTGQGRPFAPVALQRDVPTQLRVTGRHGCPYDDVQFDGITVLQRLPVRWSVLGGVPRSGSVDLGYGLGWSDDPAAVLAGLVRQQPPG